MPILTTSGMVLYKAGKKVDAAFSNVSGSNLLVGFISGAEALVSSVARYNFVSNYSSLNIQTRELLSEVVSNVAAVYVITYDMGQYTTRTEAESMINVLRDGALRGMSLIRDKKVTDFIINGS